MFDLAELDPKALLLDVHHDEDAEIYLNGTLAATLGGSTEAYDDSVTIRPEALSMLRRGTYHLDIHCHQT